MKYLVSYISQSGTYYAVVRLSTDDVVLLVTQLLDRKCQRIEVMPFGE